MHSVLLAHWAHTVRMQSAHRAHMLKNPTNAQRVASARNEWSAHAAHMQRACSAHAARMQRAASERQRSDDCAYKETRLSVCVCVCVCAKFDQFLPVRSHFDTKRPVNFFHIATFQSATFGRPLFAFVLCVLRQKIIKKPKMLGKRIDRRNR